MITFGEPPGEAGKALFTALRDLYVAAGAPTVRAIAERTALSRDTVHRALTADRVPRWATVHDIVTALDGDTERFRQLWAAASGVIVTVGTGSGKTAALAAHAATRLRVAIVDDHQVVLDGLRVLLEDGGFEIVGTATDTPAAVAMVLEVEPDVVVMDVRMPSGNGIDATAEILTHRSDARVLILTSYSDDPTARDAVHAGARGFLLKDVSGDELVQAVGAIANGQTHWGHPAARRAANEPKQEVRRHRLTPRECEVLEAVSEGLSREDIAKRLNISVRTLDSHNAAIARKTGTRNRVQMALYAIEHGLVVPPRGHAGA
ncbi:DNA-binding NarL/FixJ family response regulator [Actinokineospora baliensis]|uniref:response regulator n=1 Tax=Actinokineospora baliensis TaxID=547056 RepID=UPI00195A56E0|nr:response regulator transcription factor [Actinokineospora baliensis]MBM7775963.1 DNA-binding NarL/FixJ family response regulator [Actinokineospora baliensis]